MIKRFAFDNTISLIGAWLILIMTIGLYYIIWAIIEYIQQKKYSYETKFIEIIGEQIEELKPSYWWSC